MEAWPVPRNRAAGGSPDTIRCVVIAAAVASVGASLARLWSSTPTSRIDFYVYGEAISFARDGGSLYDYAFRVLDLPFLYPPFAALLLWPASVLTNRTGEVLGLVVSMASTVAFLGVVGSSLAPVVARRWPETPLARSAVLVPSVIAAGVWVMPVTLTARLGQVNALVAALVVFDVWLVRRARTDSTSRIAGVGTGLAAAIKLTPAALVPYFLLARRGRQAAVAVGSALLATVAGAIAFPSDTWRFFTVEVFSTDRAPDVSIVFNHSIRRFASWIPDGRVEVLVWLVLSVAVMVWAYRRAVAADRGGDVMLATTLVMLATYLVNPLTWGHHLFFLVPATLWWLATSDSWWRWAVGALAVVSLFDPIGGGETSEMTVVRVVVMIVMLVALPVGHRAVAGDPVAATRPRRSRPDQLSAP
jgi:alpha-1,2-mannosyltransferase